MQLYDPKIKIAIVNLDLRLVCMANSEFLYNFNKKQRLYIFHFNYNFIPYMHSFINKKNVQFSSSFYIKIYNNTQLNENKELIFANKFSLAQIIIKSE